MMERKVIQVGSSIGITLPLEFAKQERIRVGDIIQIEATKSKRRTKKLRPTNSVRPEILGMAQDVIEEYRPLLKKLSDA